MSRSLSSIEGRKRHLKWREQHAQRSELLEDGPGVCMASTRPEMPGGGQSEKILSARMSCPCMEVTWSDD
jgi:hypothetical protein